MYFMGCMNVLVSPPNMSQVFFQEIQAQLISSPCVVALVSVFVAVRFFLIRRFYGPVCVERFHFKGSLEQLSVLQPSVVRHQCFQQDHIK